MPIEKIVCWNKNKSEAVIEMPLNITDALSLKPYIIKISNNPHKPKVINSYT
jgi:hypothetical protein